MSLPAPKPNPISIVLNLSGEEFLRLFHWFAALAALGLTAASRHWLNPDYMSYLDVGEAWLRGDFVHAVNGYWNPVYPLIAASMASLFPNNEWDPFAGHLGNLFLYLGAQAVFHWLLRQTQEFISGDPKAPMSRELVLGASPVFIWCGLLLTSPKSMGPDVLVGASLMGAAGMTLRIANRGASAGRFALLGLILGLGYLTKVIMLSVSLAFFASLVLFARFSGRFLLNATLAALVFVMINAPHVIFLSKVKGRIDLGDTGRLAYAWLVNDVSPLFHWTGEPPGFGSPVNPPKRILEAPEVFDYSQYPFGTFPPGYDPSYWNEGLRPRPNWTDQKRALAEGISGYARILLKPAPLLAVVALLLCFGQARRRDFFAGLRSTMPIFLPSAAGMTLYLLVLVDDRYVGYFLLLAYLALLAPLCKALRGATLPKAFTFICLANLLVLGAMAGREALAASLGNNQQVFRHHLLVAKALKDHGLQRGDRIAIFGRACEASYARLAEVQIIAEGCAFHGSEDWLRDAAARERAVAAVLPLGVRAIVLEAAPPNLDTNLWVHVAGTKFSIRFPKNQGTEQARR